jgi:hypothetical protein
MGRLSFSEIGDTLHPTRSVRVNEADTNGRVIIAFQKRVTTDAVVPFKNYTTRLAGMSGEMWFVCVATTEEHHGRALEKLNGRLYIFHDHSIWKLSARNIVKDAQKELREANETAPFNFVEDFEPRVCDLKDRLNHLSSFNVGFELQRTGEVKIIYESESIKNPHAPHFSNDEEHMLHIVAAQTYFFLKDLSHNHQHHRPSTDTLLDLHKFVSERHWREQVLYSLYRKIISYKRHPNIQNISDSKGVLAYAQAFVRLSGIKLEEVKSREKLPYADLDALRESLAAAANNVSWSFQYKTQRYEKTLSFLVAFLGLFFALVSLLSLSGEKFTKIDPALLSLGALFLERAISILILIIGIVIFSANLKGWSNVKNLMRIVIVFSRYKAILFFVCLAIGNFTYVVCFVLFGDGWIYTVLWKALGWGLLRIAT